MTKRIIAAALCCLFCTAALTACGNTLSQKDSPSLLFGSDEAETDLTEEDGETENVEETTADEDSGAMAAPITPAGKKTADDEKDEDGKDGDPAPTLTPAEQYEREAVRSADEMAGVYRGGTYTAEVKKTAEDELTFTVTSAPVESRGYRWTISGFFAADTIRVNYTDAKKSTVYYNDAGQILREETEYENGLGRMQFTGDGALLWMDEMEATETVTLRKAD